MRKPDSDKPIIEPDKSSAVVETLGQSAGRALDIIDCFTPDNPELSVSEVAQLVGLTPSTASRLLATLESRQYVMREQRRGKYRLGLAAIALGGVAVGHYDLRNLAWPYLRELSDQTDCATNLGVKFNSRVLYLVTLFGPGSRQLQNKDVPGRQLPLHCTALGKVLLSGLSDEQLEREISTLPLVPHTPNSITTGPALLAEVQQARRHGYAFDRQEEMLGSNCLAAPVWADNKMIAAVSLTAPTFRFTIEQVEGFIPAVQSCAYNLTLALRA